MKKFAIKHILSGLVPIGSKVIVEGWVRTRRDVKSNFSFINLYDGSCFNSLQIVVENTLFNYDDIILHITSGCCISVMGFLIESIGLNQLVEVKAEEVIVLGWVNKPETYPMSAKRHSLEHLRSFSHLRPRTNIIGAVARIRHEACQAIHSFMNEQGFIWVSTPLITASDAEGAGSMFRVSNFNFENIPYNSFGKVDYKQDFFGKEAFLTVSGQLNGEAYACALSKIYAFGPTFRAEHSNTVRHLAEFWMIEPEMAFANLNDISVLAEYFLKYVLEIILNKCIDDMKYFVNNIDKFIIKKIVKCIDTQFIQIDYSEIINLLQICGKNFKTFPIWGVDLSYEHERYLVDEYFKSPIIIKNYPKDLKAFYMRLNDDGKTVAAMDILVPGIGEIIGGSQREERIEVLDHRLSELNLNKNNYWWYRDLRQYGTVPHSGFGLGFERLILYITGVKNIRDIIPFPRNRNNLNF